MNTTNIVSTPNITGNIGSCTSSELDTPVKINLWEEERQVIITNSCTGLTTQQYTYTSPGPFWFPIGILIVIGGLILIVGLLAAVTN